MENIDKWYMSNIGNQGMDLGRGLVCQVIMVNLTISIKNYCSAHAQ